MTSLQVTSAATIRNLVGSIFKVNPTKVYLANSEISPNYQSIHSILSGGMWNSEDVNQLWGFSPQTGFVEIKEVQYDEWNTPDGMPQSNKHNTLKLHEVPNVEQFVFFLKKRAYSHSIPSNGVNENSTSYILYKSPNFKEFWAKVEQEDVKRWSNWINA